MRALYLSHNGMLEGLGQSQVLPYLRGLTNRGVEFDLISFELPTASDDAIDALRTSLNESGIHWSPLRRQRDPRLRIKVVETLRGISVALSKAARRRPLIVHGRSYLPTAIADVIATLIPGARLIFDCRGMLGDEYVDAGYWSTDRREYRLVKRYEARAFRRADGVVVLTNALRRWVLDQRLLGPTTQLACIPTCVDLDKFDFRPSDRERRRRELGLGDRTAIVYAGSLGGLYRDADMARFVGLLKQRSALPITFVVLTASNSDEFVNLVRNAGLAEDEILVRKVLPAEMPSYLCAGDVGLAFGKGCFARLGCSPTKLAEYLACGLPVVTNGDFGDQGELVGERDTCVVVEDFGDDELSAAADRLLALAARPLVERAEHGRALARSRFGLAVGIDRYEALYRSLTRRGSESS